MPFIRPSSLQIAESCSRSPWLANRYPEDTEAARKGTAVDADVSAALVAGDEPKTTEGRLLVDWLRGRFGDEAVYYVQRKVTLVDPVTGEVITEGTPDLLVIVGRRLHVVDWKTIGQWYAGHLRPPEDNLQQQAYGVAGAMELELEEFQIILATFDAKRVTPIEGPVWAGESWWPLLERIKLVPPVDFEGPEPPAIKGEHCDSCYQKQHCSAYLLPGMQELPTALVPFSETRKVALTHDQAVAGLEWLEQADEAIDRAKKVRTLVEGQLRTYADTVGPIAVGDKEWGPIPKNGNRTGPTLGELEEMGLSNLIKPGKPGVKYDWKKVAKKVA